MKYILMAFGLCFGVSLYFGIGLLLLVADFIGFEGLETEGGYWTAMVFWPILLVLGFLRWCIEKIDKMMEE